MSNKNILSRLRTEYQEEIESCKEMIITRLNMCSQDELIKEENLREPFSLDCILIDSESQINHTYDVSRMDTFNKCLSDIDYMLAYEA
jgi:hypothetical protein